MRKGNPKGLNDWPDLLKDGVQVIVPNPKTSGNGRYTFLSAWGYAQKHGADEEKAKEFVGKLFKQAPVLDTGGRAATTTFMTNQIGDVLVTFENEAEMIAREFGRDQFEVIYPSVSAEAEPPVTVVDKVVDKKGTRAVAEEYLKYLWSPEGQEIAAKNYLRPRDQAILAKYNDRFPKVDFLSVEKTFGDWREVQKKYFSDGGVFDQIYSGLARFSLPGYSAYASMKGAIEVLSRYQAKELGPRGISVNTLAPGAIATDFSGGAVRDNPDLNAMVANNTALGRAGLPDDIGGAISTLLADGSNWITGQRIEASGGMFL